MTESTSSVIASGWKHEVLSARSALRPKREPSSIRDKIATGGYPSILLSCWFNQRTQCRVGWVNRLADFVFWEWWVGEINREWRVYSSTGIFDEWRWKHGGKKWITCHHIRSLKDFVLTGSLVPRFPIEPQFMIIQHIQWDWWIMMSYVPHCIGTVRQTSGYLGNLKLFVFNAKWELLLKLSIWCWRWRSSL